MKNPFSFFKITWKGILGIASEISLVLFFIFTGFLVCILWWGLFK